MTSHVVLVSAVEQHQSVIHTYIYSFLDSIPIEGITEFWVDFLGLSSRLLLVTCFIYSRVYMSVQSPIHFLNSFICTFLFLVSTYKWYHKIFVLLTNKAFNHFYFQRTHEILQCSLWDKQKNIKYCIQKYTHAWRYQ